jgi:hypothetical protein
VNDFGSTGLAIASAVIAAAAAGVAVWRSILAGRQAREARKARELSAVISLFNAHQSEDAGRIHHLNQLNFIATLRARHLLSDELVKELFSDAARACWEQCARPRIPSAYHRSQWTIVSSGWRAAGLKSVPTV